MQAKSPLQIPQARFHQVRASLLLGSNMNVHQDPHAAVHPAEALSLLDDEDAVVGRALMLAALMLRWRLLDGQSLVLRDAEGGPLRYGPTFSLPILMHLSRTPLSHTIEPNTPGTLTHMAARRARRVLGHSARGQPAHAPGLSRALGARGHTPCRPRLSVAARPLTPSRVPVSS